MSCRVLNLQGARAARLAEQRAGDALRLAWEAERRWCAIRREVRRRAALLFLGGVALGFVAGVLWMGRYL